MADLTAHDECAQVEAYSLGALDASERASFEAHLGRCSACAAAALDHAQMLASLSPVPPPAPPDPGLRAQILDLAEAPRGPIDVAAYEWHEVFPGIKVHLVKEDPARHMRACLVWGKPGAIHPRHRHHGDELVLVLTGAFKDSRAVYRPGDICRSRTGSVHMEAVDGDVDCICYALYYGELEMLPEGE